MLEPIGTGPDSREDQCKRAAEYMTSHPGCTLLELQAGADLGSASKVVSEMERTFGYCLKRERCLAPTQDGTHYRRVVRYTLESRPANKRTGKAANQ